MIRITEKPGHAGVLMEIRCDDEKVAWQETERLYQVYRAGYCATIDQKPIKVEGLWYSRISRLSHCD